MDCPILYLNFFKFENFSEELTLLSSSLFIKPLYTNYKFNFLPVYKKKTYCSCCATQGLNNKKEFPLATSKSMSLISSGIVNSTTRQKGDKGYTRYMRESSVFSKYIVSQLVGHLLGDGALVISKTSITPYFVFTQTFKRFSYVWFVFQQLSHYCNKNPRLTVSTRKGTSIYTMQVLTRSYPILLDLYKLFYSPKKTIKVELLLYLNDIVLAYWAMDDGSKTATGFYLHTKGFTFSEVYLVVGMLHYQFSLNCSVQNHEGRPVIYIKKDSMNKFKNLVLPHFHPSMLYKLNVN